MLALNFPNPFVPITSAMLGLLNAIHSVIPSYGFDMVLLALIVRLAMWPLAEKQFKSMAEMQKVQPLLKALQAKFKGQPQELQAATMALYKEHGVNPLAGCFPMLIQLPVLLGLFYAINSPEQLKLFKAQHFLWIGSSAAEAVNTAFDHFKALLPGGLDAGFSKALPHILAPSLGDLDFPLFVLYIVSMYVSVRYGSPPSSDPQQAQTQKIMAFVSPAMIAWFGVQYHWASALLIYWLSLNVFTMSQQLFMYRRFGLIGPKRAAVMAEAEAAAAPLAVTGKNKNGKNGSSRQPSAVANNGSTSGRSRRSKR